MCYMSMFLGCSALTTAPELPATDIAYNCYTSMFGNCTSLTEAPVLPAQNLQAFCYMNMFTGCSSLRYVKAMFNPSSWDGMAEYAIKEWLDGTAADGIFVMNAAATYDPKAQAEVPSTWTVQTATR